MPEIFLKKKVNKKQQFLEMKSEISGIRFVEAKRRIKTEQSY